MNAKPASARAELRGYELALSGAAYDRDPRLTARERRALETVGRRKFRWPRGAKPDLARLLRPIDDALDVCVSPDSWTRSPTRAELLAAMRRERRAFWGFDRRRWVAVLREVHPNVRALVIAIAYLLCGERDLHREFAYTKRVLLCRRIFGAQVAAAVARVEAHIDGLGYGAGAWGRPELRNAIYELMLEAASPRLEDLARPEAIRALRERTQVRAGRRGVCQLAQALVGMGILTEPPFSQTMSREEWLAQSRAGEGVPAAWLSATERWYLTSTLALASRRHVYYVLVKAGRWLASEHRAPADPASWTRTDAAAWVAAVDRMRVGELSRAPNTDYMRSRSQGALRATTKSGHIGALSTFFSDLQEWGWIERRFDPRRALSIPRSIRALIGPDPRVIADDVWAKLVWAGLNLQAEDLPLHRRSNRPWYPVELVRAVAVLWLFSGLRNDEITRLRVGCTRFEADGSGEQAICLLEVPTNKTGTAFTKPVDRLVGEAVCAWEATRPPQGKTVDRKTAEPVELLFAWRGRAIGRSYLNRVLIPLLCEKAGVPREDARGAITTHRGRATIATQLYNAKEPMSLTELQAWLGHRSPHSTQHYARITPTTLARAYTDAGYFERNLRTISVLVDRDAARSGAVAAGEPLEYFDLGHGYCTYDFFEQCPHRMACARCDFYLPKDSERAQLLEAKSNLARMAVEIPLTDDERAAVEDGQAAVERLLDRLADVATPAGPTPRGLAETEISGTELPMLGADGHPQGDRDGPR